MVDSRTRLKAKPAINADHLVNVALIRKPIAYIFTDGPEAPLAAQAGGPVSRTRVGRG